MSKWHLRFYQMGRKQPYAINLCDAILFDIKMEDFRCKVRLVARNHITAAPATIIHTSVVLRKMVRIALIIATLNDLEATLGDILNAYVHAPVAEKMLI